MRYRCCSRTLLQFEQYLLVNTCWSGSLHFRELDHTYALSYYTCSGPEKMIAADPMFPGNREVELVGSSITARL